MFPEACSGSARGQAPGKGRRGGERGGATPNHTGLAWEDSPLSGRVGAVNPVSPRWGVGLGETCISQGE